METLTEIPVMGGSITPLASRIPSFLLLSNDLEAAVGHEGAGEAHEAVFLLKVFEDSRDCP
jgi:hypothetical protein